MGVRQFRLPGREPGARCSLQAEVGVAVVVGSGWIWTGLDAQAVGTGDWRHGCGDGHGSMGASLGRVIGRLLDGE